MISSQLMHKDYITMRSMESIQTAARKMRESRADVVVVLDEDGRFRGLLTEKEMVMAALPSGNAEQVSNSNSKRKGSADAAYDDGNRCNYFSDVAIELLTGK